MVLVHYSAVLGQRGVDVEAGLDEQLEDLVSVSLGGDMERTDAATPHTGLAGGRDEHQHDPEAQRRCYKRLGPIRAPERPC